MIKKRGVDLAAEEKKEQEKQTEPKTASVQTDENKKENKQKKASKKAAQKDALKEAQAKIEELEQKVDETEDKYLRAEAEIANTQTRYKKEQERLLKYAGQSLAQAILPAIDNLSRALEIDVADESSKQLKKGVEMVAKDIRQALSSNDVTQIEALGQKFDPKFHQAIKTVPVEEGQEPETVVQVFQEGYLLKDRVLRPAMVVVAQ